MLGHKKDEKVGVYELKKVESCTYYCAKEKIEWKIYSQKEETVIEKGAEEKKNLPKEYLSNLDIFLSPYLTENWESTAFQDDSISNEIDRITIVSDGVEYCISRESFESTEDHLFEDIERYFKAYFKGEIQPIQLSFHSFDGGGPDYNFETEVKGIFTWYSNRHYQKADHEMLCGAGYDVIYELYPLKMGKATGMITGFSPICPVFPRRVLVEVDENLNMTYHIEHMKSLEEEG